MKPQLPSLHFNICEAPLVLLLENAFKIPTRFYLTLSAHCDCLGTKFESMSISSLQRTFTKLGVETMVAGEENCSRGSLVAHWKIINHWLCNRLNT
jgi:hypothetical protein